MILKTFFVFFTMALTSEAQIVSSPPNTKSQPKCPQGYACLKLCSQSDFRNCGDVFPTLYNPSFCALSKQGKWKSQTFACAACKNPDVIGVMDGKCSCQLEGCPQGQICIAGFCSRFNSPPTIPETNCAAFTCKAGQRCVSGRCIPIPGYCRNASNCKSFELCIQNKCIDKCAAIRCRSGTTCVKGQCLANRN